MTSRVGPVVALVVGRHSPPGRLMGHAGTLSFFGSETAGAKIKRLQDAGVIVAKDADSVVRNIKETLAY